MQVAQRLALVGRRHARHAADQQWAGKPIASHALVFLYQDPVVGRLDDGLHVASRLFLAGADVSDLPTILGVLHERGSEYASGRGFDPRSQLSTNVEPMHDAARYIGIAVSTLDRTTPGPADIAPSGQEQEQDTPLRVLGREYDTPFRVLGMLIDDTQLAVRGAGMSAPLDIRTTHTLDTVQVSGRQRWTWIHAAADAATEPELPQVWAGLDDLHTLIMEEVIHITPY